MIRIASFAVLCVAGGLAYGAFEIIRSSEPSAQSDIISQPEPIAEPEQITAPRSYFLAGQDLENGMLAFVIYGAGEDGGDVVIIDRSVLRAAQSQAYVGSAMGNREGALPGAVRVFGAPDAPRIAALFRNDEIVVDIRCAPPTCGPQGTDEIIEFAGLIDGATPLIKISEAYSTYQDYLDSLTFVQTAPEFEFLGLKEDPNQTHPVEQQIATGRAALPTIHRFADDPLDVDSHTAALRALIGQSLPDGVTLGDLRIEAHDPAIIVDADSGRPATRGGAQIPFPEVLFYTPKFDIIGTSDLPEDVLETLTEDAFLRVDWDAAAQDFIAALGVPCPDCFAVDIQGEVFNRAVVYQGQPEYYTLEFYDLREAP